ncbi:Mce-associated membrane protein [Nocardia tenerifensis]|uniref:Mce-associated membrane protein n=1 Tax=Nocardia tenerifensis TaxID=228006 RepID=A0A318K3V0_9NOCA|nr:hypothetical protein [Nocardia tenerifensis]PXX62431.1 Mce-associated membrane protein [Nocardia tenerifensis]
MSRSTLAAALLISAATCTAMLATAQSAAAAPPEEARLAGCEFGTVAGTYDYARFDEHVGRMREITTGMFRAEFEEARPTIQANAAASHSTAKVDSVDCRVVSGDEATADVTVDVVRTTTSDETAGMPKTNKMSLLITVENVNGRWLVNRAETR